MVKSAVYMAAFYLVYSVLLSRDTSYVRNRAYILITLGASMLLPFFTLQTGKPMNIQLFGKMLSDVFITAESNSSTTIFAGFSSARLLRIIYTIYFIGAGICLFKLIIDLINLLFLIIRKKKGDSRIISFTGFNTAGFSAMGYIFINTRLNEDEACEIIKHEQNHLKQNHFIDIVFLEAVKAFQWFNPVIYLLNRSLRAIHEYQADHDCLTSGVPVLNYQSLLLGQVFKTRAFNLTNSFSNPSLVKKRMIMMTKKRTSAIAGLKLLIVVPVIGLVFLAISAYKQDNELSGQASSQDNFLSPPPPPPPVTETKKDEEATHDIEESGSESGSESTPYVAVEVMPEYPGGDMELLKYLGENTRYPETAKDKGIEGRVIIRFCVTETGKVTRVNILKGVDPELDTEAIRVVKTLPLFKPGRQNGRDVPVWYMVPITFTMK